MSWFDDVFFDCCFSFFGYEQFTYKLDYVFFFCYFAEYLFIIFLKSKMHEDDETSIHK